MKRIVHSTLALLLILTAVFALPACSDKNKLPADYVKGEEIVIDNETPYIYDPEQNTVVTFQREDGTKNQRDVFNFAASCEISNFEGEGRFTYKDILKYYGNKPIRCLETDGETLYYTVYSCDDNTLCYIYFEKEGEDYLISRVYSSDIRNDYDMAAITYPHDLPSAILGDKLPEDCYLENYSSEKIAKRIEEQWSSYYDICNQVNIPHSLNHDRDGVECRKFIRCIQSVSFDLVRDENTYHGYYVYDLYTYEDGTGVLYFDHLYYENLFQQSAYHIIQEETIPLTVEEVSSVVAVMIEKDFANHPTWNPEEFTYMDGSGTDIFAAGNFGGGGYKEHLIAMWSPTPRYPHHHIRTAIEDLVRAHVTVEEGRIYRKDLYEEYDRMQ